MGEPIVLYVDDERANRVVFEHAFRSRFTIRCAATGDEALKILRDHQVAVLLTDQRMPGMSGHELLELTRQRYPDVIRVVITAYSDIDPILRAVNDGLVARYMVKPWDRAELEQVIAWAVETHALARRDSALQLRIMQNERLATIGSIGAAVLHDLQQPLASMRLNLERMAQHARVLGDVVPKLPMPSEHAKNLESSMSEIPELMEDLLLATDVMQGIVQHLRTFLRPDTAPASDVAQGAVDPLPMIRYAISVCREITARMMGQIVYDGASKLPHVRIGGTELTQVLINLIANASNSIAQGGRVLVTATPTDEGLRIVVADNGLGMAPEVLQRAGTPFFSTRAQGTGLGLSQCHRLLGVVGARLEIESAVGSGTIVRFTLPVAG